jgi:acyl carrier protein
LFEAEDQFGCSIPQDSVAQVRTLSELAAVIDELLAAKPAGSS